MCSLTIQSVAARAGILLGVDVPERASRTRQLSVGQGFNGAFLGQQTISVEDLVDLSAAVAYASPKGTQDGTGAGGGDRFIQVAWCRSIENDGDRLARCDYSNQLDDAGDLDQVDGLANHPLQLLHATGATLQERKRAETDDDRHRQDSDPAVHP